VISTSERVIGAHNYSVTQLGFKKSREVFARLTKMIGPALAELLSSGDGQAKAGAALAALCAQVSEPDLEYLCDVFAACTLVKMPDGKQKRLDADAQEIIFGGHIEDCFKWLAFCLEANYAGFFGEFRSLVGPSQVGTAQP
jgi:hypothetical protein